MDTLGEIATALGNDAALNTTLTTSIGLKAPIASPTFTGTVTIPSGASISGFAPLASPALTGTPTAPTAAGGTSTTQVATTAFVIDAVTSATAANTVELGVDTTGGYVATLTAGTGITLANNSGEGASPTVTVDTSVIQARVTNVTDTEIGYLDGVTSGVQGQINLKAPLASPALTGTPTAPTAAALTNTTQVATTAFVSAAVTAGVASVDSLGELSDVATTTTATYAIGDTGPAGGKIFITPSTAGNSTGKYFEAAPSASEVQRTWATNVNSNQSSLVSGADGTAIGTGAQNTIDIVAQSGNVAATSAAAYASDYSYGGFSDWFLPSKDELNQLYTQKTTVGGFSNVNYWSSSEDFDGFVWFNFFMFGDQATNSKDTTYYVRPVRSFDETTSLAVSGQFLKWNGSSWVSSAIDADGDQFVLSAAIFG